MLLTNGGILLFLMEVTRHIQIFAFWGVLCNKLPGNFTKEIF